MKSLSILISLFLLGGCATPGDWTRQDTIGQIVVTAALAADAYTTSKIQYAPGVYEAGPVAQKVLGLQPSTSSTYQYFLANAILNYAFARYVLPPKLRPYWQGWEVGVHGYAAWNNCRMDLGC